MNISLQRFLAAIGLAVSINGSMALPTLSAVTTVSSFSIPRSPSGMFFDGEDSGLLYILCGTNTNGDHYLYAYDTDGNQKCLITIPQAVGMSRVDGFYITHDTSRAYIVDSQGPIYAGTGDTFLGGSLYQVEWTNPCGCSSDGSCTETDVEWSPTLTESWVITPDLVGESEGGGQDPYFRNSGVVVAGSSFYAVNGVHPVSGSLTVSYSKSIVKIDMATGDVTDTWSYDGSTIGHDVDMEGLTCGADQCESTLFVGDEYNYIYALDLASGEVTNEWDLNVIVGSVPTDKGIESLTYASSTGYFYAGIQETAEVHVVSLDTEPASVDTVTEDDNPEQSMATTLSLCEVTDVYPKCEATTINDSSRRIRKEIRSLSEEEWNKVVAAMWALKSEESMASGQEKYGEHFRTYDYFVVKHAVATTDTRGDLAHFGAHFILWHSAFVLEFENAILSVDPTIEALPYWDETISEPSAFTDNYFGADTTAATSNQVVSGKFAKWPVSMDFSIDDWMPFINDESTVTFSGGGASPSILRGGDNNSTNEFVTRYGSGLDWEASAPTTDAWWACATNDVAEWVDWYTCIESGNPSIHSGPHASIGGDSGAFGGDFKDPITSPNSPIFMFHHSNLERNRLWWMMRHNSEADVCTYYGFPVEDAPFIGPGGGGGDRPPRPDGGPPTGGRALQNGSFEGAHLNDVISSSWGFTPADLALSGHQEDPTATARFSGSEQLTNADVICWLNPETVPYTYDTNFDCLNDSSNCNTVQGEIANRFGATAMENEGNSWATNSPTKFVIATAFSLTAIIIC